MAAAPGAGAQRALARAAGLGWLIHPFPTLLNGLVTAALALLAGGTAPTAVRLGAAMVAFQASIGALNDLVDAPRDAGRKPRKPIPAGLVRPAEARAVALGGLGLGALLAAPSGAATLLVALAGVGAGYLYDLWLKGTPLGWLPFAVGLPILPVFAWLGSTGSIPEAFVVLLPLGALAGAALAAANALADLERDLAAGTRSIATALGRRRAWSLHVGLHALVLGGAAATAVGAAGGLLGVLAAGLVIVAGIALVAAGAPARRELGWEVEAAGTGLLAVAWIGAAVGAWPFGR